MRFGMALAALVIAASAARASDKVERKVEVNGATYRVTTQGNTVTVAKKAFVVKYTIEERDAQRKAVFEATGCDVVDEFPNGAKLKGRLDCSKRASPPHN